MFRLISTSIIFLALLIGANVSTAKSARRSASHKKVKKVSTGEWQKGVNTVIKWDGQINNLSEQCSLFDIKINKTLDYSFECQGQSVTNVISLKSGENVTVTRRRGQITITTFNFLFKKPQTSKLEQSSLRIPFVEEIIYIKTSKNGELAFYHEKFRLDEFGRIVRESLIQAHGLEGKSIKISSLNK